MVHFDATPSQHQTLHQTQPQDDNENDKKSDTFSTQNNNSARTSHFSALYIFFAVTAWLRRENPWF